MRLMPGDPPPELIDFAPFKAVLIIEADVEPGWQAKVSRWLADTGCRYMIAWGAGCRSWDSSVDVANLEQFDYGDIPDDDFIMTTWHDNEALEQVLCFAKTSANHPTLDLQNVLFLHIGPSFRGEEISALFAAA
ncbi:MAG: hypothetical protein P8106_02695 [Gammaproteobacteria bacterium]